MIVWRRWFTLFFWWSRVTTQNSTKNHGSFILEILLYNVFVTAVIVNMSMTTSINLYISFRLCVLVIHRTITISGLASLFCYRYSWSRRKGLVVISPLLSLSLFSHWKCRCNKKRKRVHRCMRRCECIHTYRRRTMSSIISAPFSLFLLCLYLFSSSEGSFIWHNFTLNTHVETLTHNNSITQQVMVS